MFKVIETDGRTSGGPLVGRLRGVAARGELRPVVMNQSEIFVKFHDPHFRASGELPSPLPAVLPNQEAQWVVSDAVVAVLKTHVPELVTRAVRVEDAAGKPVATYQMVEVAPVANVLAAPGAGYISGYHYDSLDNLSLQEGAPEDLPALFHASYTPLICARDDLVGPLEAVGVLLHSHEALAGPPFTPPRALGYQLLEVGTGGAALKLEGNVAGEIDDVVGALEKGKSLAGQWPADVSAKMQPPKSRKKVVDLLGFPGATILSQKARQVIEPLLDGVAELLDIAVHNHDDAPVRGTFCVLHVTATRAVHGDESDIAVNADLLWTLRELEFDASGLEDKPAFFRLPGARYSWVFVRDDVVKAMTDAKLTGFRVRHPDSLRWPAENGGFHGL